jgi:putative Mg2+ transporter-C (MgtC) family protein
LDYFDPLAGPFWSTVGVALLCGAVVGMERQLHGKPVGVRTGILICLSTSVFIRLGSTFSGGDADPTRVLAQIVTGVGFLGAGVILTREGTVMGVTTAAVIWVLAAIGSVIGLGHYLGAIALSVITVVLLTGLELLESSVRSLARGIYKRE